MIVYKVLKQEEFIELERTGKSLGSSVDKIDGFIHLSTKKQLPETLRKHFYREKNLMLMAIESDSISPSLKWAISRNNQPFPHLYSELIFDNALWFAPLEFMEDRHVIPTGL